VSGGGPEGRAVKAWLLVQWKLLRCTPRLISALVRGDDAALAAVEAEIVRLHQERDR